jgi:hypothetical protein
MEPAQRNLVDLPAWQPRQVIDDNHGFEARARFRAAQHQSTTICTGREAPRRRGRRRW